MNNFLNKQPKVAILSPYYNREDAVSITIDSILDQSYKMIEVYVWDDCSTDNTWQKLVEYENGRQDSRLVVYKTNKNIGMTRGFNEAISKTDAEFIAIVGSGDICHSNRIEKQVAALIENPNVSFCVTNSNTVDPLTGIEFRDHVFSNKFVTIEDIQDSVPFTHGSVMYRSADLKFAGGYNNIFKWCSDWDLFFRMLKNNPAIYIDELLYTRFARSDGVSFHPQKSIEQISYKYLAKWLNKEDTDREKLVENVEVMGIELVQKYWASHIRNDLYKRVVKLILMRRYNCSNELYQLTNKNFGKNGFFSLVRIIFIAVSLLPLKYDNIINFFRGVSKWWR